MKPPEETAILRGLTLVEGPCPAATRVNTKSLIQVLVLVGFLLGRAQLLAQEKPPYTLPDDPTAAWAEVQKVHQALRPPDDWRTHEPTAEQVAAFQKQVHWGFRQFLQHLCESEAEDRRQRRIAHLLKQSELPDGKSLGNLDETLLPAKIRRQLPTLLEGGFVERENIIVVDGLGGMLNYYCREAA